MLPMKAVRKQLGELLAADATTLAPAADNNHVALIKAAFTPDENMVAGDIELADFTGSASLLAGLGTQLCGVDPATGQQIVTIKEPAGGWRWEATNADNLPQTIFGFALLNEAEDTLLGVQALDEPITIHEAGEEINIGVVKMAIVDQPMA